MAWTDDEPWSFECDIEVTRPCLIPYNSLTGYKEVIFIQNSSKNL